MQGCQAQIMDNIEVVLEKIFVIVDSISKAHGNMYTFMQITEQKMPDNRDVMEIKKSIGRSDQSLVSLIQQLHQLRDLIEPIDVTNKNVQELTDEYNIHHKLLSQTNDNINNITNVISTLKIGESAFVKEVEKISKIVVSLRSWAMVKLPSLIGIIFLVFMGINYFFLFDAILNKVLYHTNQRSTLILQEVQKLKLQDAEMCDTLDLLQKTKK